MIERQVTNTVGINSMVSLLTTTGEKKNKGNTNDSACLKKKGVGDAGLVLF